MQILRRESSERRKAMETWKQSADAFGHSVVGKAVNAERQWRQLPRSELRGCLMCRESSERRKAMETS